MDPAAIERFQAALKAWLSSSDQDESPLGGKEITSALQRLLLPGQVKRALEFYTPAEKGDWGFTYLHTGKFEDHKVTMLWLVTDGGDGYFEAFDSTGPFACACTMIADPPRWMTQSEVRSAFSAKAP